MEHRIYIKIYYEDTDAGGVVYYGKYLAFAERARTEFLKTYGIDVAEYHRSGIFFVITHVDIFYRKPARLGDVIEVVTEVKEMKNASMVLRNRFLKEGILLVEAQVTIACINTDGRPLRLPEEVKRIR